MTLFPSTTKPHRMRRSGQKRRQPLIPVAHLTGSNMDSATFYQFLQGFLTDKSITKICHNYVFESSFSYKSGIVIQAPVYDTICAAQMTLKAPGTFRTLSDSGLKTLALNLCKEPLPSFTVVTEGLIRQTRRPSGTPVPTPTLRCVSTIL